MDPTNFASPRQEGPYPDRDVDCEHTLEASVQTILEHAEAAGWTYDEASVAIISLVDNLMLQRHDLVQIRERIDEAFRRFGDQT